MYRSLAALLIVIALFPVPAHAFGRSLDDMYRAMLKDENAGDLPQHVVNRESPSAMAAPELKPEEPKPNFDGVRAELPRPLQPQKTTAEAKAFGAPQPVRSWEAVVRSVQSGSPSPFDVAEIERRAGISDKEAVELMAWMYANGVGVAQDLKRSWELYSQAANMGVKDATKNANAVYRAMTAYQRSTISPF